MAFKAKKRPIHSFLFFFIYYFSLEYKRFPRLCWFLLYNEANQLHAYVYPLPMSLPPHPTPLLQAITEHRAELPVLQGSLSLAVCFTHDSVHKSVNCAGHPLSPTAVSTSPLAIPALQILRNGYPLQYPCLENPMDRGAWWATDHGVAESQTRLSN